MTAARENKTWDTPACNLFGLVLAGGLSKRMGQDKAALVYAAAPQIQRVYDLLRDHCVGVFVSSRRSQGDASPFCAFPQVFDAYPFEGPLNGILSAMRTIPHAAWLAVACDLPNLDQATLAFLLSQRRPGAEATVFVGSDGLPNPICGIYEPAIRPKLLALAAHEKASVRRALMTLGGRVRLVCPPRPNALFDANTPEDRARAIPPFNAESARGD